MSVRFTHAVECIPPSCSQLLPVVHAFVIVRSISLHWMDHNLFICSPVTGHLDCFWPPTPSFWVLWIKLLWTSHTGFCSRVNTWEGIAESCVKCVFIFVGSCQTVFQSGRNIPQPHHRWMRGPTFSSAPAVVCLGSSSYWSALPVIP